MRILPKRIVSGGQTGVDRAALDAAMDAGIPCGGYVPKGCLAEDGRIPNKYSLEECDSTDYAVRTELNVLHSDATLILYQGSISGGTQLTLHLCQKHRKPVCVVAINSVSQQEVEASIEKFLAKEKPEVLNVAGPRESSSPGIYTATFDLLCRILKR